MSHLAIIIGISGCERYLARDGATPNGEVERVNEARRFRAADSAERAAREHIGRFAPCVQRHMGFVVKPADPE